MLDFANSGQVDPRVSLSRASATTAFMPNGLIRTLANNVPNIGYDPESGRCLGLHSGGARANTLSASERMWDTTAWVVGNSLGGGAFASSEESYDVPDIYGATGPVTKFTMVAAADTIFARQALATTANTNFVSLFLYIPAQVGASNYMMLSDFQDTDSGSAALSTVFGRWVRHTARIVTTGNRSWVDFNLLVNSTYAPPGFIFYAMGAQLTPGVSNGPYLKTTTGAASRAADSIHLASRVIQPLMPSHGWAFTLSAQKSPLPLTAWPRYLSISDGSDENEFMVVDQGASGITVGARAGGAFQGELLAPINADFTLACSYQNKELRFSFDGGDVFSRPIASVPKVDRIYVACGAAGANIQASASRFALYSRALTDAQLRALSA